MINSIFSKSNGFLKKNFSRLRLMLFPAIFIFFTFLFVIVSYGVPDFNAGCGGENESDEANIPLSTDVLDENEIKSASARKTANEITQSPKQMNNLVKELINYSPIKKTLYSNGITPLFIFNIERETAGWIYIKLTANCQDPKSSVRSYCRFSIDDDTNIIFDSSDSGTFNKYGGSMETMRYIESGKHKVKFWAKGNLTIKNITIREIPELSFLKLEYKNPSYSDPNLSISQYANAFSLDTLAKNKILQNFNVIISENKPDEYKDDINKWHKKGGKWNVFFTLDGSWVNCEGYGENYNSCPPQDTILEQMKNTWGVAMDNPLIDGIFIDEIRPWFTFENLFPTIIEFLKSVKEKKKNFIAHTSCYCTNPKDGTIWYEGLYKELFDMGYKIAPQCTYAEEEMCYYYDTPKDCPHEKLFSEHLGNYINDTVVECKENGASYSPRYVTNNITSYYVHDYVNSIPYFTQNTNPSVDYKAHIGYLVHELATNPAYVGQYGIDAAWTAYTSLEGFKWFAHLVRHYGINGNKKKIESYSYDLVHIKNPGFEDPIDFENEDTGNGWVIQSSFPQSVSIAAADIGKNENGDDYFIEGSFLNSLGFKDTYAANQSFPERFKGILTKRGDKVPNILKQNISSLTAGSLYSLTMFALDKKYYTVNTKTPLDVSITIDQVDIIKDNDLTVCFGVGESATFIEDSQGNDIMPFCVNLFERVFKTKGESALLTISDWKDQDSPPMDNKEIFWDFVEVQPIYTGSP